MKRKFTTVTRVFRLFADIFDLSAILPKLVYFFSTIMNTLVFAPLCTSCNEASFLLILGYVALADLEINLLKKKSLHVSQNFFTFTFDERLCLGSSSVQQQRIFFLIFHTVFFDSWSSYFCHFRMSLSGIILVHVFLFLCVEPISW